MVLFLLLGPLIFAQVPKVFSVLPIQCRILIGLDCSVRSVRPEKYYRVYHAKISQSRS